MWECAGVVRDEAGLQRGLKEIESIRGSLPDVDVRPDAEGWSDLAHALDLTAMCRVAEATLRGALERRETRGCHNRSDYPQLDQDLQVNFLVQLDGDGKLLTSRNPTPEIPPHLKSWTIGIRQEATADRLLE
jgi:succinate dehydrogenase / fumarate reductase flavoprotein subunit